METLIEYDYELVIWPDNIKEKDINDMILVGFKIKYLKNNKQEYLFWFGS